MTTLYNHNTLGTARKPLIPNLEFKLLHESLLRNEVEFYESCLNKYSLESYQRELVEPIYRKLKKQYQ